MNEADLLAVGRFARYGKTWSIAKHIRANTAAHYRRASKHFKAALRAAEADVLAQKTARSLPGVQGTHRNTSRSKQPRR
ncbi:MAG: ClbS/DfsB family four-helix bundle protein [Phycisphaerales bacterium]|nr:ClbS/DfsB family four-helix bundle protein [Phycisphaerales bacterium]